jgi:uncharacterized protein
MVRWGWLAALLICMAAHAGENDGGASAALQTTPQTTVQDAAATANTSACTHMTVEEIPTTTVSASSLAHPEDRVTDLTGALSDACKADLIARLAALEQRTGNQLAVLLVPSTGDDTIEQYATKVFEQWKLGHKNVDNGILLLASLRDHHVRIEVGYGLEGTITDLVAGRIIRQRILPAFRQLDYEAGISAAVDDLAQRLGDTSAVPPPVYPDDHLGVTLFWIAFVLVNVLFGSIAAWRKIHLGLALACNYGVASIVGFVCLALGQVELEHGLKGLEGALMFPAMVSWPFFAVGCGLYNSKYIRKYLAIACALLIVCVVAGSVMGYDFRDVLIMMSLLWTALGLIAAWIEQAIREPFGKKAGRGGASIFDSTSTSSSSSDSGWFSSSDSSGSSDSGWSGGDGGDSGGGGASDSW